MQAIAPVTSANLLARGQQPLLKFEIYDCCCWVDLTPYVIANSLTISTAGAEMTPDPVAGEWSVRLFNKNGRFDPDEATYAPNNEYLRVGRRIKISIGSRFGGVDYYWRRIYGFMDLPKFNIDNCEVTLSGMDNMQFLTDTKLRMPNNYWGSDVTKSTFASEETLGAEMYDEDDAMEIILDANNVTPWNVPYLATIAWIAPGGAPSTNVGRIIKNVPGVASGYVEDNNVGTVEQGKEYKVVFQYKRNAATAGQLSVGFYKTATTWTNGVVKALGDTVEPTIGNTNGYFYECTAAGTTGAGEPAWPVPEGTGVVDNTVTWACRHMDDKKMGEITTLTAIAWTEETFYFTATESCVIKMRLTVKGAGAVATEFDVDVFSIKEVTGSMNAGYNLPNDCNGPYYVTLDGVPIYYRDEGAGWYYESATKRIFIEDGRVLVDDQSLKIYYFTDQIPEEVVADLMVTAGLYDTQAEALAAMIYTATGIIIEQVYFNKGTSAEDAIKKICERCNYRFYFNYSGRPVFKPTPDSNIAMGSLDYDNLVGSFFEGETITGGTSGATAVVKSDDGSTLELIDCSGCFNDNEQIVGGVSAATADVNHPVGVIGVDEHVKNGAFVPIADDPPTSWTPSANVTLDTVVGGQVGNCMRVLNNGAPNRYAFQYMTVIIGRTYKVSVYAKQGTADAKVFVGSSGVDPTNSDYMDETEDAGAWTEFTVTFTATTTSVNITCYSIGVDVRTAYFDEITLYDLTGADFDFTESHIANIRDYEDRNEIRNRIVIEGRKEAQPIGPEETMPSELKGEASEVASINKYGEHTMLIKNHLFQDQATIDAYCATYLAAFKDPKWYTTFDTPFNPVPLVKGDTLKWRKKYEIGGTPIDQRGIIRDIQINEFDVTYKNEKVT